MLVSKIPGEMKKRGLKPLDLVEKTGMSTRTAYRIYKGTTNIRLTTLAKLCHLFRVQFLDDLIEYEAAPD